MKHIFVLLTILFLANNSMANIKVIPKTDKTEIITDSSAWQSPDGNSDMIPADVFISQEGWMCQNKLVIYYANGLQQAGRNCMMPDGVWRLIK
tara:strand:+ start:416 stop:694 length:279 start_codon:yes stop_codon:yes gene_type:complete